MRNRSALRGHSASGPAREIGKKTWKEEREQEIAELGIRGSPTA